MLYDKSGLALFLCSTPFVRPNIGLKLFYGVAMEVVPQWKDTWEILRAELGIVLN